MFDSYFFGYSLFFLAFYVFISCGNKKSKFEIAKDNHLNTYTLQTAIAKSPTDYVVQLGCPNCHGGLETPNLSKYKAPDLSYAGLRYKPDFLFNYLLEPYPIRNHIGISRMPNFGFNEREALAITLYLINQKEFNSGVQFPDLQGDGEIAQGKQDFSDFSCISCHEIKGQGNPLASDLSNIGDKLNADWVKQFIAAPSVFLENENFMPSLLYYFNADSSGLVSSVDKADFRIKSLTTYLMSLESSDNDVKLNHFEKVRKSNPDVTIELGNRIYQSQNCAGCHKSNSTGQWKMTVGPDLINIKSRIKKSWLVNYFKTQRPIRPFGFYPGSGSRMPSFDLSDTEIDKMVEYFYGQDTLELKLVTPKPSQFTVKKIDRLLHEKLPCLGCHSLRGQGGKIGPDLANLSNRLTPDYLAWVISNPDEAIPGTVMPKVSMPKIIRGQLIEYLIHNKDSIPTNTYLSLADHSVILPDSGRSVKNIYLSKCSICHGEKGNGDGYNAFYLTTPPTRHSDSLYMSGRTDDTLFDGIYVGGFILNKSHTMPGWGNSLSKDEIKNLLNYMRSLCGCNPPKWSMDNRVN